MTASESRTVTAHGIFNTNQIVIKNQKYIDDKIHIPDEKPNRLHVKKDKIILICLGRILLMQINLREKLDV